MIVILLFMFMLCISIGNKATHIETEIPRVECKECKTIRQVDIKLADSRFTYTKKFGRIVFDLALELIRSLVTVYYMREDLRQVWNWRNINTTKWYLKSWVIMAKSSSIGKLTILAWTLKIHFEGILAILILTVYRQAPLKVLITI